MASVVLQKQRFVFCCNMVLTLETGMAGEFGLDEDVRA
jgi:hypothetical protein